MDRSARLRSWVLKGSAVYEILEEGYDLGRGRQQAISRASRPGPWEPSIEYGIEVATFSTSGNKKALLRSATDSQIE